MMNVTTRTVWMTLCGAGVGLAMASCMVERRYANPNHCANQTGDDWCAARYDDGSRPYCILGNGVCGPTPGQDGCVEGLPSNDCYSPCGSSMTVLEDDSCIGGSTGGSSSTVGTTTSETDDVGSSTTGPGPCVTSEDCPDAAAPLCDPASGECVSCGALEDGDAACASEDPGLPLCVGDTCVQCTAELAGACEGGTPVCDDESNTCVPCVEHGQCGEAACNLFTGACLPSEKGDVVHVGPGQEFTALADAVASFDPMAEGTIIVHQADYNEAVTVDGGRVLAFLANDGDIPRWILAGGGAPQLTVGDATVLIDGIQVSGNASTMDPGVRVDAGRAWLDRSRVIGNDGGGIVAQNAAELVLRNCFVGGDVNNADAVLINGADATLTYSTLGAGVVTTTGLACAPPGTVVVRNSLIVSLGNMGTGGVDVDCEGADITFTATEEVVPGEGNEGVGELPLMTPGDWFMNYAAGDYHLTTPPIEIATTARWMDGDPLADIDAQARPGVDGAPDVAGADIP